jgi:hypothetical protein
MRWTDERIRSAKTALKASSSISEAANRVGVDGTSLRNAFRVRKLDPAKFLGKPPPPAHTDIGAARERLVQRATLADVRALQARLVAADERWDFYTKLREIPEVRAVRSNRSRPKSGKRAGTPCTIASDWHFGERVTLEETLGRNSYDIKEAHRRAGNFWDNVFWLRRAVQRDGVSADDHVLNLNGDMISGSIHSELIETNDVPLIEQVFEVARAIKPGLRELSRTCRKVYVPCTHGNHARVTDKSRIKTGWANSLESILYRILRDWSADVGLDNIEWIIPRAENLQIDVHGWRLQAQHGTQIKSQGGIGGILVPLTRWATRSASANYYLFGHFHTACQFESVIVNGSLIGDSSYSTANAMGGKAGKPRPPEQVNFLIDERRGLRRFDPVSVT